MEKSALAGCHRERSERARSPELTSSVMLESKARGATFRGMSTLAEIEEAIATLPVGQVEKLAAWLEQRRTQQSAWPVPPPKVERAELERIEAEIEAEFPTLRR